MKTVISKLLSYLQESKRQANGEMECTNTVNQALSVTITKVRTTETIKSKSTIFVGFKFSSISLNDTCIQNHFFLTVQTHINFRILLKLFFLASLLRASTHTSLLELHINTSMDYSIGPSIRYVTHVRVTG